MPWGGGFDDGFELDRGWPAESGLASSTLISPLDPRHDRDPELLSGRPCLTVQHVPSQQR